MVDGYSETYDANETADVIIDLIVGAMAEVFTFVTLLGLLLTFVIGKKLWKWA